MFLIFFVFAAGDVNASDMMEVSINQKNYSFPEAGTLADVLPLLDIRQADGIAIALNEEVIPRSEWGKRALRPQDRVFVIRATQGG
jgi:sulfur carrier protein